MVPFADLRSSRGFDVTMVRQSEIPSGDTNTGIKAYILDAYDNWAVPPSYVLLVGDSPTMPGWDGVATSTITDLYYATMDGENDWHPDIGRGRFPVDTAEQATIMVDKYLVYANLTGQEEWLKTAAFIATCDQYLIAEGTHNYVINSYTLPEGYSGTFPNNPQPGGDQLYCITHGATAADIQTALNQGRWMAIYSGHGSHSGWSDLGYYQSHVQNLTSYGMFPFVASHACITGDFSQPEVFGETWVLQENKAALVFWGSSDSSYWDEDDILERAMFDSLFDDSGDPPTVTEMTYAGLDATEQMYPGMARYYWETYNILGDPAVKAFLEPDLPTFTLSVEPDSFEVCSSGTVTASVEIGSLMNYSETVYLETGPLPAGITADFDPISAQAPYTSELSLTVAPGTPVGDYSIAITATDQISWTQDTTVNLGVVDGVPDAPVLLSPPDGAFDQPFVPTFEWEDAPFASSYNLQVDRSPHFGAPLIDATNLSGNSYTPGSPLEGGLCYWWHVQGEDACGAGVWADPFHFATVNLAVAFYDDIESGDAQWSHAAAQGADHWAVSTDQSHSPTHAWFVPDDPSVTDSRLWNTTPVAVGGGSTLTFWHRYQFEGTSYDGSVLEISTNGGGAWTDLGPHITENGYNGTISSCCGNPLGGRQGWTGDLTTWTQVVVDLSAFAGQDVNIRWRLGCDSSVSDVGWYIDDVEVTAPRPPNPAPMLISVTPDSGMSYEDTPVTIEGSGFVTTPVLSLGDTWLLSVTQVSSTTLTGVVPAGMDAGVYTMTLYNGDCQEAILTDAFTVITECVSPTVSLEAGSPVELGQPMAFTSTVTGTPPITYTWQFGDDQVAIGPGLGMITHTYELPGVYTVTLGVENPCGTDQTSPQVMVEPNWRYVFLPLIQK
jgi:PKD repeat protein